MSKISAYAALTVPAGSDVLPVVDVSDTSMAASGTTKKITIANLAAVDWLNAVTQFGADPSGAADSTTAIQNAITAVPAGGGVVYLPAGTYKVTSTVTSTVTPTYIIGAGRWATDITYTGSGDCIRMYNPAYPASGFPSITGWGGGVLGLTIDGTSAAAGACGLHIGDSEEAALDLAIQHFNGAGSIGLHFDNTIWWTEKVHASVMLMDNTSGAVLDVTGPATTVAAGSNGGTISGIATWGGTFGGNGVLAVASTAGFGTTGTVNVAASGSTTAVVTYTGKTLTTLTGCAYVSGSPAGTVATGGAVTLVTSTNSYGYNDLTFDIFANPNQNGVVITNGAQLYHASLTIRGNFRGSGSAVTNAVLTVTGSMPAGHPNANHSTVQNSILNIQVETPSAAFSPTAIVIAAGSSITGCPGITDFTTGGGTFAGDPRLATPPAMTLLATTGASGTALVNGTPTILTWTAPADGFMHRVYVIGEVVVTSGETGGIINLGYTDPGGGSRSAQLDAGAHATGQFAIAFAGRTVQANTAVTVTQTALTAGAATLYAELWGS